MKKGSSRGTFREYKYDNDLNGQNDFQNEEKVQR